jgi:hypothetical protein
MQDHASTTIIPPNGAFGFYQVDNLWWLSAKAVILAAK